MLRWRAIRRTHQVFFLLLFVALLFVALIYVWRKGALEWE